jgi:hypothetical protein
VEREAHEAADGAGEPGGVPLPERLVGAERRRLEAREVRRRGEREDEVEVVRGRPVLGEDLADLREVGEVAAVPNGVVPAVP